VHDGENLIKTSEWNPWYKQEFEGGKSCQIIALLNVNTAIWQVFELVENRTAWWEIGLFWRVFHHRVVEAAKDFGDATTTASAASKKKTSIAIWRPLEAKVHSQLQLKLLLSTSDDVIDDLNGKYSSISSQCDILPFWPRFHILVLGMTFFLSAHLLSIFYLDFCFPFLFGLLSPSYIWTFLFHFN
jgi:hypothetical protein